MNITHKLNILLTGLLTVSANINFSAASSDERLGIPAEIFLLNTTDSPINVSYTNEESKTTKVNPHQRLTLGRGETLNRSINILGESMTSSWAPSVLAGALSKIYRPQTFDLGPIINPLRRPESSESATVSLARSGITGFSLTARYNASAIALAAFQEILKQEPSKMRIINYWPQTVKVEYNNNSRSVFIDPNEEIILAGLEDPNIRISPHSRFGASSITGGIFYEPRRVNIAELPITVEQNIYSFFDKIKNDDKKFNIILPEDKSWNLYISQK